LLDGAAFRPLDTQDLGPIASFARADAASELQRFIDITQNPVSRLTVSQLANRDLVSEFRAADMEEYIEAVDLLCFCALSRRDFLGRMDRARLGEPNAVKFGEQLEQAASAGPTISMPTCDNTYCNADCFEPYALPVTETSFGMTECDSCASRRRDVRVPSQVAARRMRNIDRLIFVWLYRFFPSILDALTVVKPQNRHPMASARLSSLLALEISPTWLGHSSPRPEATGEHQRDQQSDRQVDRR
jgi:hypothetical protein